LKTWKDSQKQQKEKGSMSRVIIFLIKVYRKIISPMLPPSCIYTPTCSEYAMEAVALHGPRKGTIMAIKRIMRCHPWHKGGYDPVPEVTEE